MTAPDMPRMDRALAELDALTGAGMLTKKDFRRLWAEVESAQGDGLDEVDALEAFYPHAEAEHWIPRGHR